MNPIPIVGFDPSLRNWGMAAGTLCLHTNKISIQQLNVCVPLVPTGKQVRQNSRDLAAATQLAKAAIHFAKGAQAIFVEVPHGSQSARAMASYAICIGILGTLRAIGIPFFEVTANEVKKVVKLKGKVSKEEMIIWGLKNHPRVTWPTQMRNGVERVIQGKAEHMADAIAAIHAGIQTPEFEQTKLVLLGSYL
jgi:hypothetical protein